MQKENNAISFSKEIILEENHEFMEALSKNAQLIIDPQGEKLTL